MNTSFDDFDQSRQSPWRILERQGCYPQAARLIHRYYKTLRANMRLLRWHEAQMLASFGENTEAVAAAQEAVNPAQQEEHPDFLWNEYVLATVAFLQRDRQSFDLQFATMEKAAKQEGHEKTNFNLIARLAACFDKTYDEALQCRPDSSK